METDKETPKLIVSFRGKKEEMQLERGVSVEDVKARVASAADPTLCLNPSDIKLLHKGKVLNDDQQDMLKLLAEGKKLTKTFRIMATGMSLSEAQASDLEFQEGIKKAPRIRNDLTAEGRKGIARRQRLGLTMNHTKRSAVQYGFGRIETLPMLPQENQARQILTTLANDPGILACMAKQKWKVGSLAELYPEGAFVQCSTTNDICYSTSNTLNLFRTSRTKSSLSHGFEQKQRTRDSFEDKDRRFERLSKDAKHPQGLVS
jgi:hypothetical protein